MPGVPLLQIVKYCQAILQPEKFTDWDGAVNGLQVENSGTVAKIAAAVINAKTIQSAMSPVQ